MHRQPLFDGAAYWPHHDRQSVSDRLFEIGVCLPSGSNLDLAQQERVVERILEGALPAEKTWSSSTLSLG
jgi:pyridoxal phosphate-dependent aminotransferase EpsN